MEVRRKGESGSSPHPRIPPPSKGAQCVSGPLSFTDAGVALTYVKVENEL
jgi:hypothetical protein